MKNRILPVAYIAILFLYAVVFVTAIYRSRHQANDKWADESTDVLPCAAVDSMEIDWKFLLPDSVMLANESKDTVSVHRVNRYAHLNTLSGQGKLGELPEDFLLRTDQFSDFMLRFNCDSLALAQFHGKLDYTSLGTVSECEGHVLALFNSTDALNDSTLRAFAKEVVTQQYRIADGDESNTLAIGTFAYQDIHGTNFPIRLVMHQGMVDDAPVWFVSDAESPYFTYGDKEKPYYISLIEREMDFMRLSDHPDRSAESMTGMDFKGDGLTSFLLLKSKGFITYQHSENVKFVCKVGDYTFLVEHIESYEHRRSGFLITRLARNGQIIFENRPS